MKKRFFLFGTVLAAILAIAGYWNGRSNDPSVAQASATGQVEAREHPESDAGSIHEQNSARVTSRGPADPEGERDEIKKLRRELETAKAQLERITRPLGQDVLSSTVRAEINAGETLVSGGYRTADGDYELTFFTPRSITLEDGREAIEVESRVVSVGSGHVDAHGLGSLATNTKNTLQHAEAWMQDDVKGFLAAAGESEGINILASPKIVTLPSSPFTLSIGDAGGAQYSLEGNVAKNANGSFSIQSRVERTPLAEQAADGQPSARPE